LQMTCVHGAKKKKSEIARFVQLRLFFLPVLTVLARFSHSLIFASKEEGGSTFIM